MSEFFTFRSSLADRGYAVEAVFDPEWQPNKRTSRFELPLGVPRRDWVVAGGLVAVDGRPFEKEGPRPRIQLLTPWEKPLELDTPPIYVSEEHQASEGTWRIQVEPGEAPRPFAVAFSTFAPGGYSANTPPPPLPPSPPAGGAGGTPPPRCRICKVTAKGLAVAIVAAIAVQAAPAALIAAVSSFLGGVGTIAAAAFINSVVGDTADVVAEKLCRKVGLC
jgi:hypothetical protein